MLIYQLFLWLYSGVIHLAALFNKKAKHWVAGRRNWADEITRGINLIDAGKRGNLVWMHCSSLGEFEQGRPVLESIRKSNPGCAIVLSFFSPSGYENCKNFKGADLVFYLPADGASNARKLLSVLNPKLVLWVKYEYWFFYLKAIRRQQIPLLMLSGLLRSNQPFFRWYGSPWRSALSCFTHFFAQDNETLKLIRSLPHPPAASFGGDTRFDRVLEIAGNPLPLSEIAAFCADDPVLVAGSTWREDEKILRQIATKFSSIQLIIAPHEIHEQRLIEIESLFPEAIRHSQLLLQPTTPANPHHSRVLIIDNIGKLSSVYQFATVAYVGGGFNSGGIHNVLEAAVYGCPVFFGPNYDKFIEAVRLKGTGAGIPVHNSGDMERWVTTLLNDSNRLMNLGMTARRFVADQAGATRSVTGFIQENRLLIK